MRISLLLMATVVSTAASAGDYGLYVWSANANECATQMQHTQCNTSSRQACSAAEVSEDLKRYFAGQDPQINSLVASFGNGQVTFCSKEAKAAVSNALRELKANKRGRHLSDFIKVNKL